MSHESRTKFAAVIRDRASSKRREGLSFRAKSRNLSVSSDTRAFMNKIRDFSTSVEMTEAILWRFMVHMKRFLILQLMGALLAATANAAPNFDVAAKATNELAVDLHRQLATGDANLCVSPYSIETALAMTFAGVDGETRTEMARVLHLPENDIAVPASFAAPQHSLEEMSAKTAE